MNLSLKSPLGIIITTLVGAFLGLVMSDGNPGEGLIAGALLIWAIIWLIRLATNYAREIGLLPPKPD